MTRLARRLADHKGLGGIDEPHIVYLFDSDPAYRRRGSAGQGDNEGAAVCDVFLGG
jgi:hypothetical protein